MVIAAQIAGADLLTRGKGTDFGAGEGYLLSDQEYYNRFIRAKEEVFARRGQQQAAGMERGGRARQNAFLTAQGLGGTSLARQADAGLAPAFQRARMRAARARQMEGEQMRRQMFAERDRQRAEAMQTLSTVTNVEAGGLSAIPFVGGILAGATQAAGAGFQGVLSDAPRYESSLGVGEIGGEAIELEQGVPLRTVDYGTGFAPQPKDRNRTRGGGGQDFYRAYGY